MESTGPVSGRVPMFLPVGLGVEHTLTRQAPEAEGVNP